MYKSSSLPHIKFHSVPPQWGWLLAHLEIEMSGEVSGSDRICRLLRLTRVWLSV